MLANAPLRDARPVIVVCPSCAQHLMDIKDVRWASTKLELTYECTGCGAELQKSIAGSEPVVAFTSRASTLLRSLEIFRFDPDYAKPAQPRALSAKGPSKAALGLGANANPAERPAPR